MNQSEKIAKLLGVEHHDGWFYVGNIIDIDGNPWVTEEDFLKIASEILDKVDK